MKQIKWLISCPGKLRTYKVTLADGTEYETWRKDYLRSEYQWGGEYLIVKKEISASSLLEVGMKHSILVKDATAVVPIKVEEIKNEDIMITMELEAYYLFFKPKTPKEIIYPDMKCEEIK